MVILRYFILFILLNTIVFNLSFVNADLPDEPFSQSDHSELFAWKVQNDDGFVVGTGFFIDENRFITNFHVISLILKNQNTKSIFLSQEGNSSVLKVKKVLALSAFYDLALLETEDNITDYLTLREDTLEPSENLLVTAYPYGVFTEIRKTGDIIHEDSNNYTFPVDKTFYLEGTSGGPVLDKQGQVAGVVSRSDGNILTAVKINYLREFIGNMERECVSFDLSSIPFVVGVKACIGKEMENLRELAEQGNVSAQYQLAAMYNVGKGLDKDFNEAFHWFKKAAEEGHVESQYELAIMYYNAKGTQKSPDEARSWYRRAAEQGYAPAQYGLAYMYDTEENFQEASYWYEKAARQGYAIAQHNLAEIYDKRFKDLKEAAFYWCEKSARQGYAPAQVKLAIMYSKGLVLRIISFAIAFRLGKLDILSPPCCIIISITDS